ncbi:MAG: DUF3313 domain-containing protein [Bryobacteraceae bacterium]
MRHKYFRGGAFACCLLLTVRATEATASGSNTQSTNEQSIQLRKMAAGQEFSGFLKDYSNLKPNPSVGSNALSFAKSDARKNLHKYIAVIVEPVQVYLASDADESKLPDKARGVAARYFHKALIDAVSSAFPVTDEAGPLVLRLRSALIGVDIGADVSGAAKSSVSDGALDRTVNIGKVAVEMELVDSETGEQIAAMVDREPLGAGAEIGSVEFSKHEKWAAARQALDGWAHDVRIFLDDAEELSSEDAKRADESYQPYGQAEDR